MKKRILLNCTRCLWTWYQRGKNPPQLCPSCRSNYWNKKRVYDRKKKNKAKRWEKRN